MNLDDLRLGDTIQIENQYSAFVLQINTTSTNSILNWFFLVTKDNVLKYNHGIVMDNRIQSKKILLTEIIKR